jgi:acylphosphatase
MKRLIAHISGKVQGVGYSSMVVTLARTLDLKGYIENLAGGKAFIIAEGPKEDLARFVRSIRIDNDKIKVDGIVIDCREATGEFSNFKKNISRHEMLLSSPRETEKSRKDMTGNFLEAPARLEMVEREICKTNHKLNGAGSGLERQEDAIELSREETFFGPGSCKAEGQDRKGSYP